MGALSCLYKNININDLSPFRIGLCASEVGHRDRSPAAGNDRANCFAAVST